MQTRHKANKVKKFQSSLGFIADQAPNSNLINKKIELSQMS